MDLASKVWFANEVRIWGLAVTAVVGVISFAATWTHSRWQAELAAQKEEISRKIQRESDERIAEAQARAAEANQKAEEEKLARVRIEERLADRKYLTRISLKLQVSLGLILVRSIKLQRFGICVNLWRSQIRYIEH